MRYTDNGAAVLTAAGLGAAMMFLLDPNRGRRRRALVRDKLVRSAHVTSDTLQGVSRDLGNRVSGAVAGWRSDDGPVDDQVLIERVRAQLGRVVSRPGSIEVHADHGCITLLGNVAASEQRALLRAVKHVNGVREVTNALVTEGFQGGGRGMLGGWPMVALAAAGGAVAVRAMRANGRRYAKPRHANGHVTAADIMTNDPACCSSNTTLDEVAKLMRHADCGEIPILSTDGRPIGVVTDRDIVTRIVAEGMNPVAHTAEQCMTHNPITVRADTPLQAVIDTMERHQIRRVPVVDGSGACIGIVSQADIAREAHERSVGELVREVSEAPAS